MVASTWTGRTVPAACGGSEIFPRKGGVGVWGKRLFVVVVVVRAKTWS